MKDNVLVTYKRKSTLWKNANAIYRSTDWVKMECVLRDWSQEISNMEKYGIRVTCKQTGEDVTDKIYAEKYVVRLTNNSGRNVQEYSFLTKEEANNFFLGVKNNKYLVGWYKAE